MADTIAKDPLPRYDWAMRARVSTALIVGAVMVAAGCVFDESGKRMGPDNNDNAGNANNLNNNNQRPPERCDNDVDDDGDGYVDCDDGDCDFDVACEDLEVCTNGVDDDGDGDVDCADLDCLTAQGCLPEDCGNGVDDNANGLVDCADPECALNLLCQTEDCGNGVDDDGDGLIDCDDPQCVGSGSCDSEDCVNGVDDDGDGLADCADPDCAAHPTCQPEDCGNGVDDNADGLADCADPQCSSFPACLVESCGNGTDDDLDGQTDCDDSDCIPSSECGDCHPMTNAGCTSGTCYVDYLNGWMGTCMGSSGSGGQWDHCDGPTGCLPGYYCSGLSDRCLLVCRPGYSDCSSVGGSCYGFSGTPWGICM